MWILIRLCAATIGFFAKYNLKFKKSGESRSKDGFTYLLNLDKEKDKTVGFWLGFRLKTPVLFSIHEESSFDRFFKLIGLSREIQTNDQEFDSKFYIVSDHPYLEELLKKDVKVRTGIKNLFLHHFDKIYCDGSRIWFYKKSFQGPSSSELSFGNDVLLSLSELTESIPSRYKDKFIWKALVVEAVIWSLACYAIGGVLEYFSHNEDYHLNQSDLFILGLKWGFVGFLTLVCSVVVFFRGSSRGHRFVAESAIVLALSFPMAGIQAVSDINLNFDRSPNIVFPRTVESKEIRVHRGRRGRKSYSYHYHMTLGEEVGGVRLPISLQVSLEVYNTFAKGDKINVMVGSGYLGLPWYREFQTAN